MKRRLAWIVCILSIFILSSSSYAKEIEGRVVQGFNKMFLLKTEKETHEIIVLKDDVKLTNIETVREIQFRLHLRALYEEEVSGVKYATEVVVDPVVELFDSSRQMTTNELESLLKSGKDCIIIDARPFERYEAGHIPGALSMPLSGFNLNGLFKKLKITEKDKKRKLLVFYAEDKRDPSANDSARKAVETGQKKVKVYSGGLDEWVRTVYYAAATADYVRNQTSLRQLILIDARSANQVERGYIPGAFYVPPEELSYQRIVPMQDIGGVMYVFYALPIVFYGEDENDARAAQSAQMAASKWNYTKVSNAPVNILEGGFGAWKKAGLEVAKSGITTSVTYDLPPAGIIAYGEFKRLWEEKGGEGFFLDVRSNATGRPEYMDNFTFIKNIPVNELPQRISEIPKEKEVIVFCGKGITAEIGYHILRNNGYRVRYLNRDPMLSPTGPLY